MSTDIIAATSTAATAPATSSSSQTGSTTPALPDPLAHKQTFLKLLVAQIKNQNPLNPADGIEFLSQLTQFSQLEQMLEIRQELEAIRKDLAQQAAAQKAAADANSSIGA